jgi:hypothetical protein
MNFTINFSESSLEIANKGSDSQTIPLGEANTIQLPNGASAAPPSGNYWHISTVTGGAVLEGTHGPLEMPAGSKATFNVDNL